MKIYLIVQEIEPDYCTVVACRAYNAEKDAKDYIEHDDNKHLDLKIQEIELR